jgi:hypothetical protein
MDRLRFPVGSVERRSGAIGLEPNSRQLGDDEGRRPLPEQRTESCMASTELLRTPSAAVETCQIGTSGQSARFH